MTWQMIGSKQRHFGYRYIEWIVHGGHIFVYNWNLSPAGTGVHFSRISHWFVVHDLSERGYVIYTNWTDLEDPKIYKPYVAAIAYLVGGHFLNFDWEDPKIYKPYKSTLQVAAVINLEARLKLMHQKTAHEKKEFPIHFIFSIKF